MLLARAQEERCCIQICAPTTALLRYKKRRKTSWKEKHTVCKDRFWRERERERKKSKSIRNFEHQFLTAVVNRQSPFSVLGLFVFDSSACLLSWNARYSTKILLVIGQSISCVLLFLLVSWFGGVWSAHSSVQPLLFLRLRTCSAALVAISNTSRTPSFVLAEHSR